MANNFSLTSTTGILKYWFQAPIVSQFNDKVPLYRELEKAKLKWNGSQANFPIKLRRNAGIN